MPWPPRRCLSLLLAVLLTCPAGCRSGIGVRSTAEHPLLGPWRASVFDAQAGVSMRTAQTLRRLDLEALYAHDPVEAYARLHDLAVTRPDPDVLFTLAELSFLTGTELERQGNSEAIAYYYLCAGYAYHYLFGGHHPGADPLNPGDGAGRGRPTFETAFDPRFRLACELYNNGLAKCIRAAQRVGRLDPRHVLELPTADGGKFTLSVTHHGFPWQPDEFGPLLFCSDYKVTGLDNHYRSYGLGVPLMSLRQDAPKCSPGSAFYPNEVSFPVTAFFRFEGSVADLGARRAGRLELYNPLAIRSLRVCNRGVPLETDLTTPLAYFLSRTDLNGIEMCALLSADRVLDRAGIYLFEPYQPGKIPVLMVHGLFSSPLTWAPLFNELRADPVLNQRYQFWFYLYPSGMPYVTTAAELRESLARLRYEVDPHRQDPALDQMVLVGHSMGGLISKLLTQDSGHDFWHLVSKKPLEQLKVKPEAREKLREYFFFEREPAVRRVVFLGTPHRGSKFSPSVVGRLTTRLIRLPRGMANLADDLFADNPDALVMGTSIWRERRLPTSIDLLDPHAPALQLLADRPAPPGVRYHSVLGVYRGEGRDSHDGVVRYDSAHLDEAASEVVVPAHHIVLHHHPGAMLEVRRVLHQHLRELGVPAGPPLPQPDVVPLPPPGELLRFLPTAKE